ncbi:MAG: hypothetical protein GKS01_17645 [Alphaproteobacteria bacterium]|nr:hypothetical protein [Alphaproteobacteria bacterium]
MRAFEIHTFRGGKWKIDSVFDDKDLALFEARRMDQSSRYSGVRVIEEHYNETSDETVSRTIFKGGRAEKQASPRQQDAKKESKAPVRRKGAEGRKGRRKRPVRKKKKSGLMVPLTILFVIVIVGLGAMFGLQHLSILQ